MLKLISLVSVVAFLVSSPVLRADSYSSYLDNRQVDFTGRFYLVVKVLPGGPQDPGRGTPVQISLAERSPGSPPFMPAKLRAAGDYSRRKKSPDVKIREGDTLHARIELKRVPSKILISSTGLGFVGLDVRGYNFAWPSRRVRTDDAVVYVTQAGEVKFRKDTLDLFGDGEMSQFQTTAGGVWWSGSGWFDEARKQFIIVGAQMESKPKQRLFRVLNLDTGELTKGGPGLVVTALKDVNRGALELVLDLAAELEIEESRPHLPGILTDAELPPEVRCRAALALAVLGDRRGAPYLSKTALETGDYYAVMHLPLLLQDKAAPVIRDVVARHGEKVEHAAWESLRSLEPAAAVPTLIEMLQNEQDPEAQYIAAEVVWSVGSSAKQTIPALVAILEGSTAKDERGWRVESMAAGALGSIGPEARAAVPALMKFRKRAEVRLEEVKACQAAQAEPAKGFDSATYAAERPWKRTVEALEKIAK